MALIKPQNPIKSLNMKYFTTDEYKSAINQSIQTLLDSLQNPSPNSPDFTPKFLEFMQSKPNPLLESIWVFSNLTFQTEKYQKDDILDKLSAVKDLFQLITAYSASCSSSVCISFIAPVIFKLYKVVIDSKSKELDSKRGKKVNREIRSFLDVILGYLDLCCDGSNSDEDCGLIRPLNDLVSIWVHGEENENGLKQFFPLLSNEVIDWVTEESDGVVGLLAGGVIVEAFLLKMCLKFNEGGSRKELQNELRSWAVCSITGFHNFYLFDILVKMLLEPNLTVMSLLNSEDEFFLRKVLYNAVILPDYLFLHLDKIGHLPINHIKNNILGRLMVTHEAVELFRKNNDHTKAISYTNAFSGSNLPAIIIKLVTSELGTQGIASQLKGSSPMAFLKWILDLQGEDLTFSDGFMSKHRAKLVHYKSAFDLDEQSYKLDTGKIDNDLLFFYDKKGNDENEKIDESMNDDFVAAARSMQSDTNESGKKRKETLLEKNKDQVKFQRYNLVDLSGSRSGGKTGLLEKDDSDSASEVEDPDSDEDLE